MWSVELDQQKQLLKLHFAERVSLEDIKACGRRIEQLLGELKPGFSLLTDLSDLDEMDVACGPVIDQLMETFNSRGIRKIVRVIPDPRKDIGFGIMSLFHYGHDVRVVT